MATGGVSFTFKTANLEKKIRRRLAETPLAEKQIMHQIAVFIEKGAKDRAPVDQGNLTVCIKSMVAQTPKGMAAVVYVPVNSPASPYAIPMHEHEYRLGVNSQEKQRKVGVVVGRRYLIRAIEENAEAIRKRIAWNLKRWGWTK